MANYELNILRNSTALDNFDAAKAVLNNFTGHKVGQPISLLYFDKDHSQRILFALGKLNADEYPEGNNFGEDFYEIIGISDDIIKWHKFQNNATTKTDQVFKIGYSNTQSEFIDTPNKDQDMLTIIDDANRGAIYKGSNLICTLNLANMSIFDDITINGQTVKGTFKDVFDKLFANVTIDWKNIDKGTTSKIKFIRGGQTDYDEYDASKKTTDTFFNINKPVAIDGENISQRNLYIGKDIIGETYNSQYTDVNKEMPKSIGGLSAGTTLGELLKMGTSSILDKLLFPIINPVVTQPSLKILYNKSTYDIIYERGEYGPEKDLIGKTTSKGNITLNGEVQAKEYSGEPDDQQFSVSLDKKPLTKIQLINPSYTITGSIYFNSGTVEPKDTAGNVYTLPNKETNFQGKVISSSNKIYIKTYYPYFAGLITAPMIREKLKKPEGAKITDDDLKQAIDIDLIKAKINPTINQLPSQITIHTSIQSKETEHIDEYLVWCIPAKNDNGTTNTAYQFKNPYKDESITGFLTKNDQKLTTKDGKNTKYNIYIRTLPMAMETDFYVTAYIK